MNNDTIHLGHPLMLSYKNRSKLTALKADSLSHAGRLVYINSVLASFPIYYMTNILFPKEFLEKITTIIRNFWWKGNQNKGMTKPICFRAWEDIYQPKKLGGLGIKNISIVNKSMVTHTTWMVAAQKDSFLSKVLKAKYHPHTSFWKASPIGSRSVFWSSIQSIKHYINANCIYQIHEGFVNIWSEPWCPIWDKIHSHLIIPTSITPLPNQSWNIDLINQVFDNHAARVIANTPIVNQHTKDVLIWTPSKKGECSTKETYRFFSSTAPSMTNMQGSRNMTAQTMALLDRTWKDKNIQPKLKTFLWRLLRDQRTQWR
ncbi:hypothetical protein BS78_07G165500 [Paspalum vaginatum]|nr:hypothetical protein BS78_07G165500 [Paspalum vaginatum]